jgi:hypothetical protein
VEGQCERYERTSEENRILVITSYYEKENQHKAVGPEVQLDGNTAPRV